MSKKTLLLAVSTSLLSACATLYSSSHDLRLPGGLAQYLITATLNVGLFSSEAVISVNGREVLEGQSFFWTNLIEMSGTVDGLPITAVCDKGSKVCDVGVAGLHAATLKF